MRIRGNFAKAKARVDFDLGIPGIQQVAVIQVAPFQNIHAGVKFGVDGDYSRTLAAESVRDGFAGIAFAYKRLESVGASGELQVLFGHGEVETVRLARGALAGNAVACGLDGFFFFSWTYEEHDERYNTHCK